MRVVVEEYRKGDSWREVQLARQRGARHLYFSGTTATGKAMLLACATAELRQPVIAIAATASHADRLANDLMGFFGEDAVAVFPADELNFLGVIARSPELAAKRLSLLSQLVKGRGPQVVVMTWDALLMPLVSPEVFRHHLFPISVGQDLDRPALLASLVDTGYERVELVEAPGQFSVRGALMDIYPLDMPNPIRIDFFGDEVDSLRSFDVTSQRTIENLTKIHISPATEVFWPAEEHQRGLLVIEKKLAAIVSQLPAERAEKFQKEIGDDLVRLKNNLSFPGKPRYAPYFTGCDGGILDYFSHEALVLVDEPGRVLEKAEATRNNLDEQYKAWLLNGQVLPDQHQAFLRDDAVFAQIDSRHTLLLSTLPKRPSRFKIDQQILVLHRTPAHYFGQLDLFKRDLSRLSQSNYRVVLVCSEHRRKEMMDNFAEAHVNVRLWDLGDGLPPAGVLGIVTGSLEEGLDLPEIRLLVLTEAEFVAKGRRRRRKGAWQSSAEGARLSSLRDLSVGDHVVHVNHGIGKYMGIKTMSVGGVQRDYIDIQYSGEDKLYVPTEQLHLVQKYIGAEAKQPKLHALGGSEWAKAKAKVKESVEDMAQELIALYATRETVVGHAYGEDSPWQKEMEYNFAFQETPDQLRAVDEVKSDMALAKPMDRLLCGDVGYGKTEIAVRAAFKAVTDGKQVAVLVPTTILAQQHYNTFRERFAGFPLEVSLMSRFRRPEDNKATSARIAAGIVDVAIGTHRLLSSDVKWKDLGLLVIDEEQRFGVKHKEKIKQLKASVDVLTLTATPIPRTLHMAMIGLRDVSVIETPPEDRYPVQTMVVEHSDAVVKQAIERELDRGGQVYYVHNRVRTIRSVAHYLQTLLPNARIAVGHGQMSEEKLERIFLDFLEGEYDILLSTTIIESGLDISNVNTIIVEDADRLGLAQLYQLRGRVGRSTRVGYAVFTYKPEKSISEVADKRLAAIREFTQLGAGFKIALRDLEIRGAGNLLGAEQHGSVASVGFDLYCDLLAGAVRELRGVKVELPAEVEIKLPIDAYFPSRYIPDAKQKVEMYKRVAATSSMEDVDDILDELMDRYGTLPDPVANLLAVARLRIVARRLKIGLITTTDKGVTCKFGSSAVLSPENVLRAYEKYPELAIQETKGMSILWKTDEMTTAAHLSRLIAALEML